MLKFLACVLLHSVCALWATAQAETLTVRLDLSDFSPFYQQFTAIMNKKLQASKLDVDVVGVGEKADLVVAVGVRASDVALSKSESPMLSVMVPKQGFDALVKKYSPVPKTVAAIYLDQPWQRQLSFIKVALPNVRRIGMLYSADMAAYVATLQPAAESFGWTVNSQLVQGSTNFFNVLESVLADSDVLLVIADSSVYNSNNVRNILLTSYRHKVPLIGISAAYVNAGAFAAIFSTAEQIADETVEAIANYAKNKQLPTSQYVDKYSVEFNQQVANSLRIALVSTEEVLERMRKLEGARR